MKIIFESEEEMYRYFEACAKGCPEKSDTTDCINSCAYCWRINTPYEIKESKEE